MTSRFNGVWLALGATAVLGAAGRVRRGSQAMTIYGPHRSRPTLIGLVYQPITVEELWEIGGNAITVDDAEVEALATILEQQSVHEAMEQADRVLGTHGIERTHGVTYLNTGDMCATTLIHDGNQFYIGDIGTLIEDQTNLAHDENEWLECEGCWTTDDDEAFATRSLCRGCHLERYGVEQP